MDHDLPKTFRPRGPFRLGEIEVLPASNEIRTRRGLVRLRPLLMEILLRLADDAGAVVTRETLLADVWPRRMVNDEVLSRAIAELRTALGDDAKAARYIETIPKTGYRLVAPKSALEQAPATEARRRIPWWIVAAPIALLIVFITVALYSRDKPTPPLHGIGEQLANATPFSSDPALELAPRFSPDGNEVAFVLSRGVTSQIVVQAIAGSARRTIGDGTSGLHSPVFFPDGKRLAMWKRPPGGACAIVEHDLATGSERQLLDCALAPQPRFDLSGDGRYLVFTGNTRPQYPAGLWILDLQDGARTALTSPEPGMGDDNLPRFSPDGKRIAFFRGGESHRQPWIVERADPRTARVAAHVEGLSYGFAWAGPDGPLLAAADWLGFRAINVLDLASGKARLAGARGARFPDRSVRGDIVYESAIYSANLWLVDPADPAKREVLWTSTRYSNQPDFAPDGKRVAFCSNREGLDGIYVGTIGGQARRIASSARYRYFAPRWSADGRHVYAIRGDTNAREEVVQQAVRIDAGGAGEEVLQSLGNAVNRVSESRDGRSIYFTELAGNAMRLLRAPVGRWGEIERLPLPVVSQFEINATHLVFAQPHLTRLTACTLADLACKPLPVDVKEDDLFHWTLGSRSILVRTRNGRDWHVARYGIDGTPLAPIAIAPMGAGTSLALTPDESRLVVVRDEGPAVDLMLARR